MNTLAVRRGVARGGTDKRRERDHDHPASFRNARENSTVNGQHRAGEYARVGTSVDDLQTGRRFRRGLAVCKLHRSGLGLQLLVLERRSDVGDGTACV